jgi:hypothetical protein
MLRAAGTGTYGGVVDGIMCSAEGKDGAARNTNASSDVDSLKATASGQLANQGAADVGKSCRLLECKQELLGIDCRHVLRTTSNRYIRVHEYF